MLGFKIDEKMSGYHHFTTDERGLKRKMEFECTWGPDDIKQFFTPQPDKFMASPLYGTVTIEGLCEDVPIEGTIIMDYFGRGTIKYEFFFWGGPRGELLYHYRGEKVNIKPWNLLTSHTTCFGTLHGPENELVSTSVTFFKLRTALNFLSSFRIEGKLL